MAVAYFSLWSQEWFKGGAPGSYPVFPEARRMAGVPNSVLREEFTKLAETRLAQNMLHYNNIAQLTLK